MLPLSSKIAFLIFAAATLAVGLRGFYRAYLRIRAGRADSDARFNDPARRLWYALTTSLLQSRTFKKRPAISFFHAFIFYGFVFYLLVNFVDAVEGFVSFTIPSSNPIGAAYNLLADVLSALVLIGVIALVIRRFFLPSRRDFSFNERTLLHPDVKRRYISTDSLIVSAFILFHVSSRAVGAGAKVAAEGADSFQPFATLLSHLFTPESTDLWRVMGYWGALGSVLAFLAYFPFSKHIHIFMAPVKYAVSRDVSSGVLPAVALNLESEELQVGAGKLEELAWPRLLDAYACIQCNRCQDACPATATGKALSPSALEINKRMELNSLAKRQPGFERGEASPRPLLEFALSVEAAWACTTCGACLEVCPVQDEPMLDILDVRRHQVMIAGEFPQQLQTAFRGMERAKNPWGINHEKRMDWAAGLAVKTVAENPEPDVLYWVGCAASYDPQAQKTARAFVQLLDHAGVDYAVLGKQECCTGDSARRAGNELLYQQLAGQNVATLNEVKPKLVVATCPHCLNAVGKEYRQLGGDYAVMHHTEYLETLVSSGKLKSDAGSATVAYHDPCYLGRHNGVYDAPRNVLRVLSNTTVEMERSRENSFCCGAGGAQFWKEEEPGEQRISDNRYREVERVLAGAENKVLAVGCPFCKSMLESTPHKGAPSDAIAVKDVAELLLEGVQKRLGAVAPEPVVGAVPATGIDSSILRDSVAKEEGTSNVNVRHEVDAENLPTSQARDVERPRLINEVHDAEAAAAPPPDAQTPARKKWAPKKSAVSKTERELSGAPAPVVDFNPEKPVTAGDSTESTASAAPVKRKVWTPPHRGDAVLEGEARKDANREEVSTTSEGREMKQESSPENVPVVTDAPVKPASDASTENAPARKKWSPKGKKSEE